MHEGVGDDSRERETERGETAEAIVSFQERWREERRGNVFFNSFLVFFLFVEIFWELKFVCLVLINY